jgi:hypothetical protein
MRARTWGAVPLRRLAVAAVAGLAGLAVAAPSASASNFGSTPCGGTPPNCVSLGNNRTHTVRFRYLGQTSTSHEDIPGIRAATTYVLANVYSKTDLTAYHTDTDPQPDVVMDDFNFAAFPTIAGWVNCGRDSTGQGGSHPNKWCRGQTLTLNSYLYWSGSGVFDTAAQRRNVVCHELGHTVGLRHRTDTKKSCMWTYAGGGAAATIDAHDRAHINGHY